MRANLSLVLDKDGYVRLDLKKDIELSEIDKYTTTFSSSNEIREEFKEEIKSFLDSQQEFTKNFKKEHNKDGRIVLVYSDEKHNLHTLRVLYKGMEEKLDLEKMIGNIKKSLESLESFNKSLDVINHFSGFIFGSEFDRKEIRRLKTKLSYGNTSEKLCNKTLVKNIIYNHLVLTSNRNKEKAYFHVRLIDSYMEKLDIITTKSKSINNLHVRNIPRVAKLKKQEQNLVVKDGNLFVEESGQYNLFGNNGEISTPVIMSYEDYLEHEEERRLGK